MGRAGTWLAALVVVASGCGKGGGGAGKKPEGPTEAEVHAKYKERGDAQLENLRAVLGLAIAQKITSEELKALDDELAVTDLVLNDREQRAGNARYALLDELLSGTTPKLRALEVVPLRNAFLSSGIPSQPPSFAFGPGVPLLLGSVADLIAPAQPKDPDRVVGPTGLANVEEFVGWRYLVVVRTHGIKLPQQLEGNRYAPGAYAAQAIVFDLAARKAVDTLRIAVTQGAGEVSNVNRDLALAARRQLEALLGKT